MSEERGRMGRWMKCVLNGDEVWREVGGMEYVGNMLIEYPIVKPGERYEWVLGDCRPMIIVESVYAR